MQRQTWPMVFGLSVFALAAVAVAAFMIAAGKLDPVLAAGAVLLLAAGQFAVIITVAVCTSRIEEISSSQQTGLRSLSERLDQSVARLDHLENNAKNPAGGRLDEIIADVKALRESFRALIQPKAPEQPASAAPAPETLLQDRQDKPAEAVASSQHLDLLLEPVIELSTGTTTYYRALLDLADDHGHVVQHAELMQKADAGGMRPELDAHMLKHAVPVLRRLRVRNPGMRVFVPIGSSTLSSKEDMARIAGMIEREIDVANGLVFELQHRDLGLLENTGIEGLARLARLGATLALSDVQVAGLDLPSLRQLGVRFLSFPPSAGDAGFGPTPAWREFVQYARAMQFQIIIAGVEKSQQAAAASQIGRFAYGSFFAPPRKVRSNAGVQAAPRRARAA
ncbi:MAG: EAL domain-containing protein [Alphaproteobacteria bacterium]|nr:EAL domain-containing protein [Alphaproteobacteria bacterium]